MAGGVFCSVLRPGLPPGRGHSSVIFCTTNIDVMGSSAAARTAWLLTWREVGDVGREQEVRYSARFPDSFGGMNNCNVILDTPRSVGGRVRG